MAPCSGGDHSDDEDYNPDGQNDDDNDDDDDGDGGGGDDDDDDFSRFDFSLASLAPECEANEERSLVVDKRPRKTSRTTERREYTTIKSDITATERDRLLTACSESDFAVTGNQWLPHAWKVRGIHGHEEHVRNWVCPFRKDCGCKVKMREVRKLDGSISLERSGFAHVDHTQSYRCAYRCERSERAMNY